MGVLATAPNRANDGDGVTVIESKGPTHHIFQSFFLLCSLGSTRCVSMCSRILWFALLRRLNRKRKYKSFFFLFFFSMNETRRVAY